MNKIIHVLKREDIPPHIFGEMRNLQKHRRNDILLGAYNHGTGDIYLFLPCIAEEHRRHDAIIALYCETLQHEVLHRCFANAGVEFGNCGDYIDCEIADEQEHKGIDMVERMQR